MLKYPAIAGPPVLCTMALSTHDYKTSDIKLNDLIYYILYSNISNTLDITVKQLLIKVMFLRVLLYVVLVALLKVLW